MTHEAIGRPEFEKWPDKEECGKIISPDDYEKEKEEKKRKEERKRKENKEIWGLLKIKFEQMIKEGKNNDVIGNYYL